MENEKAMNEANWLEGRSIPELEGLKKEIDKHIEHVRRQEIIEARKEIRDIAKARGVSVEEVIGTAKKPNSRSGKPVKYQHPQDPSKTWTGLGRRPRWIVDYIASGGELQDLKVV